MQTKDYSPELWEALEQLHHEAAHVCFLNVKKLNVEMAIKGLTKCAEAGYSDSYYLLGDIYYYGISVEKDIAKAKEYFLKGEMQGNSKCKFGMAKCEEDEQHQYSRYTNVYQDIVNEAVDNKDPISRYILGCYYENGLGGQEINLNATVYWTSVSALSGYSVAQFKMGGLCHEGKAIEQSDQASKEWYEAAAVAGLKQPIVPVAEPQTMAEDTETPTDISVLPDGQDTEVSQEPEATEKQDTEQVTAPIDKSEETPPELNNPHFENEYNQTNVANEQTDTQSVEDTYAENPDLFKDIYKEPDEYDDVLFGKSAHDDEIGNDKEEISAPDNSTSEYAEFLRKYDITSKSVTSVVRSAFLGDAEAQYNVAVLFEVGGILPKDYDAAYSWYVKSAGQGFAKAQNNLGLYYQMGISVAEDFRVASDLYTKSAGQGYAPAQYNLGQCYLHRIGVRYSAIQAAYYLQKAADQNHPAACYSLGMMFELGKGMDRDYARAHKLYTFAADNGITVAQERLFELEKKMRLLGVEPEQREQDE